MTDLTPYLAAVRTSITLVPISLNQANEFVRKLHRHHRPVVGHKFSIGVATGPTTLVGVCIVGRPIARHFDDGETLEVLRTATDGTKNANSMLYGAAQRATFALGYRRLITYTRTDESGASLKASNWRCIARRPARSWKLASRMRPRQETTEPFERFLWEIVICPT